MRQLIPIGEESKQERILVVDDDILLLHTLEERLILKGYQCYTAASANIALELLSRYQFDIMVIDVVLPDMMGFELATKIKRIKPGMTIIIMTGHIEEFPYDRAIEAGALDFIRKPFSLKELIARIRYVNLQKELLARERELHNRIKELEEFYEIAVGRELRMKQLKKEKEELKQELEKYRN